MSQKRCIHSIFLAILFFLTGLPYRQVIAGSIHLSQSGQSLCFDSSGLGITCTGTGQDGAFRTGASWPRSRFTDHGDGTVTDELTGLMWSKDADLPNSRIAWQTALNFVDSLMLGGHSDWRLPNIKELETLLDYGRSNPALPDNHPFVDIPIFPFYWTSTTLTTFPQNAWYIRVDLAEFGQDFKAGNSLELVWPVRGGSLGKENPLYRSNVLASGQDECWDTDGQIISCAGTGHDGDLQYGVAWPQVRFLSNGSGAVSDRATGLQWTLNANLAGLVTWDAALAYVEEMNAGLHPNFGFSDWRLPNFVELRTLVGYTAALPALPEPHPFTNIVNTHYWSATTSPNQLDQALVIDFSDGDSAGRGKSLVAALWPVRSEIRLGFPIQGEGPYSAPVSAVMDLDPDLGEIEAYTGERGVRSEGCLWQDPSTGSSGLCDAPHIPEEALFGYRQTNQAPFFGQGALNYMSGFKNLYLWYDGHTGYDYPQANGTNVLAVEDGWVTSIGGPFDEVIVRHPSGHTTHYLHLSDLTHVSLNGWVRRGMKIGEIGLNHLHLTVKLFEQRLDPYKERLWLTQCPLEGTCASLVFADGLETGDFSMWSSSVVP